MTENTEKPQGRRWPIRNKLNNMRNLIPAGQYYIGDPCYAVKREDWDYLLKQTSCFDREIGMLPDGGLVLAYPTEDGDGLYDDNEGNVYPVDSGLIGLVPVASAKPDCMSRTVLFDAPTICRRDGGKLCFGKTVIRT